MLGYTIHFDSMIMALIYLKLATLVLVSLMVSTITDILTSFPNWHPTIRTVLQVVARFISSPTIWHSIKPFKLSLHISHPFASPTKYSPISPHTKTHAKTHTLHLLPSFAAFLLYTSTQVEGTIKP
ncbi:hypothetical protein L2E82_49622 [Cichorium intybus]|uniref:Uncharacterized protein n=1 Tax=Cichorium intybus TaxID=13427 RepID=A0ACB8Z1F8_CICIN|nr:hypothetical protein L2E82_49622 [Cichorium intybus]